MEALLSLLSETFDQLYIVDPETRRRVVARLLADNDLQKIVNDKYGLLNLLNGNSDWTEVIAEDNSKHLCLDLYLTPSEQTILTRNNKDFRISFEPGVTMSHALAYAQRIIDTARCLRNLNHVTGPIVDVGGNYAAHARRGRRVHSCTLVDSAREYHRATQRTIELQSQDKVLTDRDYCTEGAENCNFKASQSMSVHAMTAIDQALWVKIMDAHEFEYHVAVFHYDPCILTTTSGFLEGSGFHYDVADGNITFHFDMDSSRDYTHDYKNYLKYTTPWIQVSDVSPWAYAYDIKCVIGGVATAEIVRIPKNSIGVQIDKPYFAYVPNESMTQITTWLYDVDSGLQPTNYAAYKQVDMTMDTQMYRFLHMYGVANDTATPNRVMSFDDFRQMGRTYNHVRRFGDINISARTKLPALTEDDYYLGIYAQVVHDRAQQSAKAQALTDAMLSKQALHQIHMATVTLDMSVRVLAMPLLLTGKAFDFLLTKLVKLWKTKLASGLRTTVVKPVDSYLRIGHSQAVSPNGLGFVSPTIKTNLTSASLSEELSDYFGDYIGTDGVDKVMSSVGSNASDSGLADAEPGPSGSAPFVSFGGSTLTEHTSDWSEDFESTSYTADRGHAMLGVSDYNLNAFDELKDQFEYYNRMHREMGGASVEYVTVPKSKLHVNYKLAMLEYALYNFDVGWGVIQEAKLQLDKACPGQVPSKHVIDNYNYGHDVGIKFFTVTSGFVDNGAAKYALGIDSKTRKVVLLRDTLVNGRVRVDIPGANHVMVNDQLAIFNYYVIGREAMAAYYDKLWEPTFDMTLVDGVPGCGKTKEIIDSFTESDMVVCTGKHAREDVLRRLMVDKRFEGKSELLSARVRTLDSVSMYGTRSKARNVNTLYVDEGLMAFPGQFYLVCFKVRPKAAKVFGDSKQIHAVDRSPNMGTLLFPLLIRWSDIQYRSVSLSMPGDICVLLTGLYGRKITTRNPVRRSVSVELVTVASAYQYTQAVDGWTYATILRADRAKLLSGVGFKDGKKVLTEATKDVATAKASLKQSGLVFTVHEAQGQRFNRTNVVRINPNTSAVINDMRYVVVAISRHYYKLKYTSMSTDDEMYRLLSRPISDKEIDAVMVEPLPYVAQLVAGLSKF